MNNTQKGKIRSVTVNERGQIVIPEDIRKDIGIENATTLIMIEKNGEIIIRKETEILEALDEGVFLKALSRESMKRAWNKEDEVWDKIAKDDMK